MPGSHVVRRTACDAALVFATGIEAGGFVDRLEGVTTTRARGFVIREGDLQGRYVVLCECGVGRNAAHRHVDSLLAGHRPPFVISAGFAGGLRPALKRSDFVLGSEVMLEAGERLPFAKMTTHDEPGHTGLLITVDRVVCQPEAKAALGERTGAWAVDMESYDVVAACHRFDVPCYSLRIISDTVDETLPFEVERLARQRSTAGRLGSALGMLARRPSSVKQLMQLRINAISMSDRLAERLEAMIISLTPANREPATNK